MILWLSNFFIIQTGRTCKSVREGGRYVSKTDSHWTAIKTIVSLKKHTLKHIIFTSKIACCFHYSLSLTTHSIIRSNQWRIQKCQNGGGGALRGRIFRSGVCFDAPSHIPYVFIARVVNKIHNVNIVYWQKSKYMRVK